MGVKSSQPRGSGFNKTAGHLIEYFKNNFDGSGGSGGGAVAFSATGGNQDGVEPGNGFKYHTFTSSGSFTTNTAGIVEVLVVAGGGGGSGPFGGARNGAAGAGGVAHAAYVPLDAETITVTIGGGGGPDSNGTDSTFGSLITAKGGGHSDPGDNGANNPGGSGNGSSARRIGEGFPAPGGTATQPGVTHGLPAGTFSVLNYGNPGGVASGGNGGAGGGGAGAPGGNSAAQTNGTGGVGKQFPHFTGPLIGVPALGPHNGYYGGGGGFETQPNPGGGTRLGGLGGGGFLPGTPPGNGSDNTGGGGGGGTNTTGGPGIIIVRYTVS